MGMKATPKTTTDRQGRGRTLNSRTPLDERHWEYLAEIIVGKSEPTHTRLVALSPRLGRTFGDYEENFDVDRLCNLPKRKWATQEKADLLDCYSGRVAALSRLKADIELAQDAKLEGFCPLCGVAKAEEFDHYAPKESFPHVAVHALNLVPCCGRCNRVKSKAWLDEDGERRVLHFYLDDIPAAQFLFAEISWEFVGNTPIPRAKYRLERPKRYNKGKFSLIERHFATMKLLSHYRKNTHQTVSELVRGVKLSRPKTAAIVDGLLENFTVDNGCIFGESHWKVALAHALKGDANFFALVAA